MKRQDKTGFTLIEMLLVVAILGILAGIVVVNFAGKTKEANIKTTRASIQNICTAIDLYETDTGRYPPTLKSLIENDGSPNWSGPYIRSHTGMLPTDAWGTEFKYEIIGEKMYKITSAGPDLQFGTSDDITN